MTRRIAILALHPPHDGTLDYTLFPNFGGRRIQAEIVADASLDVDVRFFESLPDDLGALREEVLTYRPHLICVSSYIWSLPLLLPLAAQLKSEIVGCALILGGPQAHPSVLSLPEYRIAAREVDALVMDEPELVFPEIARLERLDGESLSAVGGAAVRTAASWRHTPRTSTTRADLNTLSSPWKLGLMPRGVYAYLERFRGCPLSCTFCEWGRLDDPKAILHQERLEQELDAMRAGGASGVMLVDAGLNLHAEAFRTLAAAEKNVGLFKELPFICEMFPARVDDSMLAFLDAQSAPHVGLGLQSFNPAVLEAVDRRFDETRFEELARRIAQVADVAIEIILGLPGDNPDSFARTFERVRALPCKARVYPCVVLPTALMERDRGASNITFDARTSKLRSCTGWSADELDRWSEQLTTQAIEEGGVAGHYWWEFPVPGTGRRRRDQRSSSMNARP